MDIVNKFGARNIFRRNGKTHAGDTQTLWQRGFARKLVRELAIFRQQLRVGARCTRSMVIPLQGAKAVAGTLMVQFFKDTFSAGEIADPDWTACAAASRKIKTQ